MPSVQSSEEAFIAIMFPINLIALRGIRGTLYLILEGIKERVLPFYRW